jgi:hypothetical protein
MRFLDLSEGHGKILGINLDLVVTYLDVPEADIVTLQMVSSHSVFSGSPGQIHLEDEGRRAFFDAIRG